MKGRPEADIKQKIEDYYRQVRIPKHIVTALQHMLTRQFDDLHVVNKSERHTLATNRDQLRDERRSLLHAHHAGAVPLVLLKEESRPDLSRRLAFLDSRIEVREIKYDQAKAHLEDCLTLVGNAHAVYPSLDDSLRRIANQVFLSASTSTRSRAPTPWTQSMASLRHAVRSRPPHRSADLRCAATGRKKVFKPDDVASFNIQSWVGPTGIEPMTSTV